MTFFKRLLPTLALLALAACGGGSNSPTSTQPFGGTGSGTGTGGGTTTATAANLIVTSSAAQLPNTASSSVNLTVTAVDSGGVVVSGAPVSLAADNDGVITQSAATTGTDGKITATLSIGANRANRVITVTATSGGLSKTATVQVIGTQIASTLVPAVVAPGGTGQVQYRVTDQSGSPMTAQAVTVTATGLTPASATATTDTNGAYTFSYTAPATTGAYQVLTTIGGVTDTQTVNVQSASTVDPVPAGVSIASPSVSANPIVIGTNPVGGTTSNRAEIRALFLDGANAPIKNVRVRFDLDGDPNSIGGTFSTGSATLYSDASGVVTSAYIPGALASPTDGVTVRACYGKSDTDPNLLNCTTYAKATLTVTSAPLGVSIGTDELITVNDLTYTKRFVVLVADSAHNAMADVKLSASLDLKNYRKGYYTLPTGATAWVKAADTVCLNEDLNRNGVLQAGEDVNNNGRLDPGPSDVIVQLVNSSTGPDGTAVVEVTYPKNYGSWVDALLTVSAFGVSGTEGRTSYLLAPVPVDAAAIKNKDVPPAFQTSPYGIATSCSNPN